MTNAGALRVFATNTRTERDTWMELAIKAAALGKPEPGAEERRGRGSARGTGPESTGSTTPVRSPGEERVSLRRAGSKGVHIDGAKRGSGRTTPITTLPEASTTGRRKGVGTALVMEGSVLKLGGLMRRAWQLRYLQLTAGGVVAWKGDKADDTPRGTMLIDGTDGEARVSHSDDSPDGCLTIKVSNARRDLFVAVQSESARAEWTTAFTQIDGVRFISNHNNMVAVALRDCEAERDDELSFASGDRITEVRETEDKEWFRGTLGGRRGFFPSSFVTIVS